METIELKACNKHACILNTNKGNCLQAIPYIKGCRLFASLDDAKNTLIERVHKDIAITPCGLCYYQYEY